MVKNKIEIILDYLFKYRSVVLKSLVYTAAFITFSFLFYLVGYIFIKGFPHLTPDLFAFTYTSENVSLFPALINTLSMCAFALMIAIPFGVSCAIYLVEYSPKGLFVEMISIATETLSGIPSIIYGLFGLLFFSEFMQFGKSMLSGALTLSIMILPIIIRTTQEALLGVDPMFKEGSYGLGAGKLRTLFKITLPSSMPGILSGIILSIGRVVGESAALIYTAGTISKVATSLFDGGRTLAVHMYILSGESLYPGQSFATALVLLIISVLINVFANKCAQKLKKG